MSLLRNFSGAVALVTTTATSGCVDSNGNYDPSTTAAALSLGAAAIVLLDSSNDQSYYSGQHGHHRPPVAPPGANTCWSGNHAYYTYGPCPGGGW